MTKKIVIFGNSGSGKSTLAIKLAAAHGLSHLDLDTLAWSASKTPTRKSLTESRQALMRFISKHETWVIEGCYADLIELAIPYTNELIFLNIPIQQCLKNAKARPWEAHKYLSKEEQDRNLPMLLDWIADYEDREDTFSYREHMRLYSEYPGVKKLIVENQ